jgi:hypothetical protein
MIASKELTGHREINFTVGTDVTPIVEVLYGSLYQFAFCLTRSESDAADLVQQTFLTLSQRLHQISRLLEDRVLVVYNATAELFY